MLHIERKRDSLRLFTLGFVVLAVLVACARHDSNGAVTARDATTTPPPRTPSGECDQLPDNDKLRQLLQQAVGSIRIGGMAEGKAEWAAVVDRQGRLCSLVVGSDDKSAAWPGSRAIAMAKAFTANAFSSDMTPLSTARMYTLGQPGQMLWGLAATNPFNADCMGAPDDGAPTGKVCGGIVTFGGGVPLYRNGKKVGGLGLSGDTACADHEVARELRNVAGLNPATGANADDIQYTAADGPSIYAHPLCPNTWRHGRHIGEPAKAKDY